MKKNHTTRLLAVPFGADGTLPTEFRLFVSGWNETENGRFLFDEAAAKSVMAASEKWGVDLAIDLEHQMLDGAATDPTARDARGWFRLELRADGSLWATDVKWTPDGAARLSEKRQRYISPAFEVDPESQRVTKIINAAITSIPATHHTPALVAASVAKLGACMLNPEAVKKALEALKNGDSEAALALLEEMIAAAASGGEEPAADPAMAENAAPAADPAEDPAKDEEKAAVVAATSKLVRLTGKTSIVAAVEETEIWRTSHLELETERQKLAAERATLEAAERRRLCASLVTEAGQAPAMVWADPVAKDGKPKEYLSAMPIEHLRSFVADAIKSSAGKGKVPTPPASRQAGSPEASGADQEFVTEHGPVIITSRERKFCEDAKTDIKVYAANKAYRNKSSGGR
jgi:phage I-like protein